MASDRLRVVLDIGKTLAKLSLWTAEGELVARETRPSRSVDVGAYLALDTAGVEAWMAEVLKAFAARGSIEAIVPVGHGAALAVVRDGKLVAAPVDYEQTPPEDVRGVYAADREAFAATGSPLLPDSLNAGIQLAWLESLKPGLLNGATILTWAQYWAWRLTGIAATEVTSLGCHTDLWRPLSAEPSDLARRRGWAGHLAPVRPAGEVLGPITPEWVSRTGLPPGAKVYCGLHDSNAALLAARSSAVVAEGDSTVLSTGTWFVAMRTPASSIEIAHLAEGRDCLVNVDTYGRAIPSARFMGGREIEILSGVDPRRIDIKPDQPALVAAMASVVSAGAMVLPTFVAGVGPFPNGVGGWSNEPDDPFTRRSAVCLYAALVADTALSLIGARDRILVEGRFAEAEVIVRALASLRPDAEIYVANAEHDVSFGALRLVDPTLSVSSEPRRVAPLDVDLDPYARVWRQAAGA